MTPTAVPEGHRPWGPMVAASVLTLALVAFAFWWRAFELPHYDDSDPTAYLGSGVILLCFPGAALVTFAVLARAVNRPPAPTTWRLIGWMVTVGHTFVAAFVALAILWGADGRIDKGDLEYEGAAQPLAPGTQAAHGQPGH